MVCRDSSSSSEEDKAMSDLRKFFEEMVIEGDLVISPLYLKASLELSVPFRLRGCLSWFLGRVEARIIDLH